MLSPVKICPDCQNRYDDDVTTCPDDGEELVELPEELSGNPALPEPMAASPADRTSMLDLEALAAKREAKRQQQREEEEAGPSADEETPPPERPIERDVDATGTLQRKGRRRKDGSRVASAPHGDDERAEGEGGAEPTAEVGAPPGAEGDDGAPATRARGGGTRTGMTRAGTRTGMTRARTRVGTREGTPAEEAEAGTRAGQTALRTRREAVEKGGSRGVRAAALTVIVLCLLVAGIVTVARVTAVLTVTTVPPGATVKLDGEVLGTSPIQKRVRVGSHVVELELEGFVAFKEVVDVPGGGLPYLQPLQKVPPPPPPPPTPTQIAEDLATQARQLLDNGDLDGARQRIDEARKLAPTVPVVVEVGAKVDHAVQVRDQQCDAATANASREARLKQARVLAAEGRQLYEKGRLGEAKDRLYKSLQQDAQNPEPHRVLSRIFNREDQVDKVRYHLTRYLELGGADADFKVREWLKTHPP